MDKELELSRRARRGDSVAYLQILLDNDRGQVVEQIAAANPEVFEAFKDIFLAEDNETLAKFIVTNWRGNHLKMPKFDFMAQPGNHKSYQALERYALSKRLDKIAEK